MNLFKAVLIVLGLIGLFSVYIPIDNFSIYFMMLGFIGLIVVGHRIVYKKHKHSVLGLYTDPINFLGIQLHTKESMWVVAFVIMCVSSLISIFIPIVIA